MTIVQSVQEVGPCRKRVQVEIPASAVEEAQSHVLRELGKSVSIPGFRKGKVPKGILKQRFGGQIDQEVKEYLLPRYWEKARAEAEIEAIRPPELEKLDDLVPGEPLTFVASVEVRPELEIGDLEGFELPDPSTEASDDEIQEHLDELRRRVADWAPVEREAARGDLVTAEITEIPETPPQEGEGPEAQTVEIEVGDERVWEELSLAVTGLSAGQQARFSHREPAPEDGPAPPERHFSVEVVAVKERDLPELDDDFARTVGDFEDLDELRSEVRKGLEARKTQQRREERREALVDQLRERYPFEVPKGAAEDEADRLMQDYAQSLARQGMDVENAGIDWSKVRREILPKAEERVHSRLLLDRVADHLEVTVETGELEEALASLAREQGTSVPVVRRMLQEGGRLESFQTDLRRSKTLRQLMGELSEDGGDSGEEAPAEGVAEDVAEESTEEATAE